MYPEWCKFCKHGWGFIEKGQYIVYCHLSRLEYPTKKDPQDTCKFFEQEENND